MPVCAAWQELDALEAENAKLRQQVEFVKRIPMRHERSQCLTIAHCATKRAKILPMTSRLSSPIAPRGGDVDDGYVLINGEKYSVSIFGGIVHSRRKYRGNLTSRKSNPRRKGEQMSMTPIEAAAKTIALYHNLSEGRLPRSSRGTCFRL